MSRVLPRSDSFNGKGFSFGEPLWRSAKLHISDGAASSSGEVMIRHSFLRWLLWLCRRQVTGIGVKLRDVLLSFSVLSCRSLRDLYFNLYDMNETRITMKKRYSCIFHTTGACLIVYVKTKTYL